MHSNPIGCPQCGQKWDNVSDGPFGLGRVRAVHPPGPCVPRPAFNLSSDMTPCANCGTMYDAGGTTRRTCSEKCRHQWQRERSRQACLRYHERRRQA